MLARLRCAAGNGGYLCRRLLVDVLAAPERASAFRAAIGRLRAAEYHEARIPVRRLTDLWPSPGHVTAAVDALTDGNPTALELFCLGAIVRASGARHIFEIGTFDGATTLQLALTVRPTCSSARWICSGLSHDLRPILMNQHTAGDGRRDLSRKDRGQ